MAKEQRSFSFPLLKPAEVLSCMSELQIPLSEEELKGASAEVVHRVFETVVDICMGVTKDELDQPAAAGLQALEFGELHDESIPQLSFFRAISKLMETCDVTDFSLKDIHQPDAKRFRRQLSGVINFVKFREDRLVMYTELSKETDGLSADHQMKKQQLDDLQRDLDAEKATAAAQAEAHEALDAEIAELEENIEALNQDQAKAKHEMKAMKKTRDDLRDDIQGVEFHLQTERAEVEALEAQVVHSPRRIKRDMAAIAAQHEAEKAEIVALERQLREKEAEMARMEQALVDAGKVKVVMDDVREEMHKEAEAQQVVDERREQLEKNAAELEEVATQRQNWQKQLNRLDERTAKNASDHEMKIEAAQQALEAAQTELEEERAARACVSECAEQTDAELRAVQQQIETEAETEQAHMQRAVEGFKQLQSQVRTYNRQLLGEINA